MLKKDITIYRLLVILNTIVSVAITHEIILYNMEYINYKIYFILLYALIWFFSLYKIYFFSKTGLKIYILLVTFGFVLNMLSDYKVFGPFYYFMTLFEHLIIGAIIALSFYSKVKIKFS
ncbi:MAG: hypothetical protein CML36_02075 [Rhodobacteraceae bacterium]|nr:hypothetical protein [Paracoccaceae bacterium]OUU62507.1 MAG: hypothetical protein CBC22_04265 [Alphaproteobacteria bacterium TMED62]|tara:strand:- start:1786 stop:2142 length:357 start_codon:yes stop_codon:yes gene_type:complete